MDQCNRSYRFGHDLKLYREIIDRHREGNDLDSLLGDNDFYTLVFDTLEKWNMDQRGAKLAPLQSLKASILNHRSNLLRLYQYKLESMTLDKIDRDIKTSLQGVFAGLQVMQSQRRIVGVSKALHFLLPDLVIPIDGRYTLSYRYGYNKYSSDVNTEFNTFWDILVWTCGVVKRIGLTSNDVDNLAWNTSVPKLIDNAIIGSFKYCAGLLTQPLT